MSTTTGGLFAQTMRAGRSYGGGVGRVQIEWLRRNRARTIVCVCECSMFAFVYIPVCTCCCTAFISYDQTDTHANTHTRGGRKTISSRSNAYKYSRTISFKLLHECVLIGYQSDCGANSRGWPPSGYREEYGENGRTYSRTHTHGTDSLQCCGTISSFTTMRYPRHPMPNARRIGSVVLQSLCTCWRPRRCVRRGSYPSTACDNTHLITIV